MKLALSLLLLAVTAVAQTVPPSSDTGALVQLEKNWADSLRRGETAFLDSVTAPEWTNTGSNGRMRTKPDVLDSIRSGGVKLDSVELSELKARVYGDAAVVTGIFDERGASGGKPFRERGRFTDTFIRRNGKWLCVATHTSNLPE
jgi:hypothetical protein